MHAPKMVNLLENYSAVLFQVGLQNVEDNAISKPKKRNPKPTLIFFFFFFSGAFDYCNSMHLFLLLWPIHEYAIFLHAGSVFRIETAKQSLLYSDVY